MISSAYPPRSWLSKWLRARFLPPLVAALALVGATASRGPAPAWASDASCPAGLAGQFVTSWHEGTPAFEWYKFFGEHTFAAGDVLHLSFAVVPFDSGITAVTLDEIDGRTGYQITFQDGLVNGSLPYAVNGWNSVEAEFNFAARQYTLTVNGVSSTPVAFNYSDSHSAQAFRISSSSTSTETTAWFDSITVVKSAAGTLTTLFAATFDNGAAYPLERGSITSLDPPGTYLVPAVCTSAPMFAVSPTLLKFHNGGDGSSLDPQFISVQDNGISPVSWTAEESLSWLTLSSAAGATPAQIEVSVALDGLEPGAYTGQITLSSDDVEQGRTQTVHISLTVYSGSSSAERPCPAGLAGKFVTGWGEFGPTFEWYESLASTPSLRLIP